MAKLSNSNADTIQYLHPAESCATTAKAGPRGGISVPRTEVYRRNGRTQRWVRQPDRYSIPMKYGLRDAFRVTSEDMTEYHEGFAESCELGTLAASLERARLTSAEYHVSKRGEDLPVNLIRHT